MRVFTVFYVIFFLKATTVYGVFNPLCPTPTDTYKYPQTNGDCSGYLECVNTKLTSKKCDPPTYNYNCESKKCEDITHCCASGKTTVGPTEGPTPPTTENPTVGQNTPSTGKPTEQPNPPSNGETTEGSNPPSTGKPTEGSNSPTTENPTVGSNPPATGIPTEQPNPPSTGETTKGSNPLSTEKTTQEPTEEITTTISGESTAAPVHCRDAGITLPIGGKCNAYYKCDNSTLVGSNCPSGLFYNCFRKQCTATAYYPCCKENYPVGILDICTRNGQKIPNPFSCSKYFTCVGFRIQERTCPDGQLYNWMEEKCQKSDKNVCTPGAQDNTGAETTETTIVTTTTTETSSRSPLCPQDGIKIPDTDNCKNYYECVNGNLKPMTCGSGKVYNCFTKSCTFKIFAPCCKDDTNITDYPHDSSCIINKIKIPNPFTCNKYFECDNKNIVEKECSTGYKYNWLKMTCVLDTDGECSPGSTTRNPLCSMDGIRYPMPGNCQGYMQCDKGKLIEYQCPPDENYNCKLRKCEFQVVPHCCSEIITSSTTSSKITTSSPANPDNGTTTVSNTESTVENTSGETTYGQSSSAVSNTGTTVNPDTSSSANTDNGTPTGNNTESTVENTSGETTYGQSSSAVSNTGTTVNPDTSSSANTDNGTPTGNNTESTVENTSGETTYGQSSSAVSNTGTTVNPDTSSSANTDNGTPTGNNTESTVENTSGETTYGQSSSAVSNTGTTVNPDTSSSANTDNGTPTGNNTESTVENTSGETTYGQSSSAVSNTGTTVNPDSSSSANTDNGTPTGNNTESTVENTSGETTYGQSSSAVSNTGTTVNPDTSSSANTDNGTPTGNNTESTVENTSGETTYGQSSSAVSNTGTTVNPDTSSSANTDNGTPTGNNTESTVENTSGETTYGQSSSAVSNTGTTVNPDTSSSANTDNGTPTGNNTESTVENTSGETTYGQSSSAVSNTGTTVNPDTSSSANTDNGTPTGNNTESTVENTSGETTYGQSSSAVSNTGTTVNPDTSSSANTDNGTPTGNNTESTVENTSGETTYGQSSSAVSNTGTTVNPDTSSSANTDNGVTFVTPSEEENICPIDGAKLPDPTDCNGYYVCQNQVPVKQSCRVNEVYSCWNQQCEPAESGKCVTQTHPGDACKKEGTIIQNADNCRSYYECKNGKVQIKFCESGKLFNVWFEHCLKMSLSHCSPGGTHTSTTESFSSIPSTSVTPSPTENICPIDGAMLPDPTDCNGYYECQNQVPVKQSCRVNEVYSCWNQQCEPAESGKCVTQTHPGDACKKEGTIIQNADNCRSYYECKNGKVQIKFCESGKLFNVWFKRCLKMSLSHCSPGGTHTSTTESLSSIPSTSVTPSPTENICPIDGATLPDPTDCNGYYECQNQVPVKQSCRVNEVYSCWNQQCEPAESGKCVTQTHPGDACKKEGTIIQNADNCRSYYECKNGKVQIKFCESGKLFNIWFKRCLTMSLSHCSPGGTHTSTTESFSSIPSTSVTPSPTENICPIDGATLPDPTDCNGYYECQNQVPVKQTCPINQVYSCWDQQCEPDKTGKCVKDTHQGDSCKKNRETIANADNCNSYYECENGKVTLKFCESGKFFNVWFKKCVSLQLSHCTTEPSDLCPQNDIVLPDVSDCSSYYKCQMGKPVKHKCPGNLVWNCILKICTFSAFTPCCKNDPKSPPSSSNCLLLGLTIPNPFTCDKYFECRNHTIYEMQCPAGQRYDWIKMKCVEAKSSRCAPTIGDNSTITEPTVPSKPGCTMGQKFTDIYDPHSYYECVDGKEVHKKCSLNLFYNCWSKFCTLNIGIGHCNINGARQNETKYFCPNLGSRSPDPYSCSNYYECVEFQTILKSCNDGQLYDSVSNDCVSEEKATCIDSIGEGHTTISTDTPPPTETTLSTGSPLCPQKGVTIPDKADCASYFECDETLQLKKKSCPKGLVWNCIFKICTLSAFAPCCKNDPKPPPSSSNCLLLGLTIPNPFACDKYFECRNHSIYEMQCPAGQRYDWIKMKCVEAKLSQCAPSTGDNSTTTESTESPKPTCTNGQKLTDIHDSHSYYECVDGKVVHKKCLLNLFYNCWSKICTLNIGIGHCNMDNKNDTGSKYSCSTLGSRSPDPYSCSNYYECVGFQTILKPCNDGQLYDVISNDCVSHEKATCIDSIGDGDTTISTATPPPTEITSSTGSPLCPQKGITMPDKADCTSYFVCDETLQLKKKRCLIGLVWNCFTESCTLQAFSPCCKNDPIIGSRPGTVSCVKDGIKIPDSFDCSEYWQCEKHRITKKTCKQGQRFDWIKLDCRKDKEGKCAPGSSGTSTEPPESGSSSSTSTTVLAPTSSPSTTTTQAPEPSTTTSTTMAPLPRTTTTTTQAPKPTTTTTTTMSPSQITKSPSPLCPSDGIRYPSTTKDDCGGYLECQNRQLVHQKCTSTYHYNCETKQCENITHCCAPH